MVISHLPAVALLGLLAGCGGSLAATTTGAEIGSTMPSEILVTPESASVSPVEIDSAVKACLARTPARSDILVRNKVPTLLWSVQLLGGGYAYNHASDTCQDSVEYLEATTTSDTGHCIEIALASSNPGYNPEENPAPPLRGIIGSKGTCD